MPFSLFESSAAFIAVDRTILFEDIHVIGFPDNTLALMKSYLLNRFQKVKVDGEMLDAVPLQYWVPLNAYVVMYQFHAKDNQF